MFMKVVAAIVCVMLAVLVGMLPWEFRSMLKPDTMVPKTLRAEYTPMSRIGRIPALNTSSSRGAFQVP